MTRSTGSGQAEAPALGRRLRDWEERLAAYLAAARTRPHAYGEQDCLLHCAAIVEAVTGVDLAAVHRGRYRGRAGALRYLAGFGFGGPAGMISSLLPARLPSFARRGDLVLGADGIPGVCLGGSAAFVGVAGAKAGLVTTARREWIAAWSVGEA